MNYDGTETSWSGSGGGFSQVYSRPSFQDGLHSNAKRGLPDLAAQANPAVGYAICFAGQCQKVGGNKFCSITYHEFFVFHILVCNKKGTSAVAPLYAGLSARLMQLNGIASVQNNLKSGGFYTMLSYNDVNWGNNGGYSAVNGWDPVTGLGSFKRYTLNTFSYPENSFIYNKNSINTGCRSSRLFASQTIHTFFILVTLVSLFIFGS